MKSKYLKRFLSVALSSLMLLSMCGQALALGEETQEDSGWSEIPFSEDTVEIFVSSSEGADSNDGLSAQTPVATIEKAISLLRDGYPDHMLLKRGDVWTEPNFGGWGAGSARFLNGRSAEEPMVISYYGDSGDRPLIRCGKDFINHNGQARNYVWVVGLHVKGYKMDPNDPAFDPNAYAGHPPQMYLTGGGADWLIEDCKFEYVTLIVQSSANPLSDDARVYRNFRLRRCIIIDVYVPYSTTSREPARPCGIYASGVNGMLIEECTFDRNGWNPDLEGAGANMFNHNMYLQSSLVGAKTVIRGNICTRASANGLQARAGGLVEDNLFTRNSIGMLIADDLTSGITSTFGIARNNVITEGVRQSPFYSSSIQSSAVFGLNVNLRFGSPMSIVGNIVAHRLEDGDVIGIQYRDGAVYEGNVQYEWCEAANLNGDTITLGDDEDPGWLDPNRSVGSYNADIRGGEGTLEAFLEEARNRPLGEWPEDLTAYAVNAYIREGFTSTMPAFVVDTDAGLVKKGDYFNVSAGFESAVSSNTAVLTYTYNPDLFEYRAFKPADGATVISAENDASGGVVKVTLMIQDYNTLDYGEAMFSARDTAVLSNSEHSIGVRAKYVYKDANGDKFIYSAAGSTSFATIGVPGDTTGDDIVDLIDLSNVIDWFGADTTHPDWSKIRFYDYNNNGKIDIADIAWVASLIKS